MTAKELLDLTNGFIKDRESMIDESSSEDELFELEYYKYVLISLKKLESKTRLVNTLKEGREQIEIALKNTTDLLVNLSNENQELREALENIKTHQMNYVQLARTTEVYKIAEKALNKE